MSVFETVQASNKILEKENRCDAFSMFALHTTKSSQVCVELCEVNSCHCTQELFFPIPLFPFEELLVTLHEKEEEEKNFLNFLSLSLLSRFIFL